MTMPGLRRSREPGPALDRVFDRDHLARYTLQNAELEMEIIRLFLDQLPVSIAHLRNAGNLTDWKLATHTLKGAAAAIGATRIHELAAALEACKPGPDGAEIASLIASLDKAVEQFRQAISQVLG